MKGRDWIGPVLLIALLLVAAGWYFYRPVEPVSQPLAATEQSPPPAPADETAAEPAPPAEPQNPVPASTEPAVAPLPPLSASDAAITEALVGLLGAAPVEAFLVPREVIRRFVVMVDNLPRASLPTNVRAVRKMGGTFQVQGDADAATLSPGNAARYAGFVEAVQLIDARPFVALYFHYYPLFQEAYAELGKRAYFNDRLIEVIDHLLAAPEVSGAELLVLQNRQYRYADPALEARSAGQKVLMRMGDENADIVRSKLTELRDLLVKRKRDPSAR